MTKNVLVVGGTVDSRHIIDKLLREGARVFATVTTEFGKNLLTIHEGLDIITGKLNYEDMLALILNSNINCLVDASHPFAMLVSENAMKAAKVAGIPYIRYERNEVTEYKTELIRVKSHEEAASEADSVQGNIFLTIGSNSIEVYTRNIYAFKERIFARVLPDSKVLEKCEGFGLSAKNIIAMKGPFTEALNIEMLRQTDAKVLVMKNSGEAGGTMEKISAAEKLKLPVIMLERPQLSYSNITSEFEGILKFIREVY